MQTTIRIRLSEMDSSFLKKLRIAFEQLSANKDPEIEIVLNDSEYDPAFVRLIQEATNEIQAGKKHVFTMDSLTEFVKA